MSDNSSEKEVLYFLAKIGFSGGTVVRNFELKLSTDLSVQRKYVVCSVSNSSASSHLSESGYEVKSLDKIWQTDIDDSIAVASSKILEQLERSAPGSVAKLEDKFLQYFELSKKSNRVFFTKSETAVANEVLISFLGAFAVANGEKTARLCMHKDQDQVIQEMLMIHAEPIVTGPLRQNRDSSVSYHMVRGALEITLHHGGTIGDKVYLVERNTNQSSINSSIRVPAKVFRTIRTLTDSAVFIEVQSGPFTDSDTEWQSILEHLSSVRRILVVGATGLIGSQLSQFCEDQGMEVFRTSRSVESNQKNSLKINFLNLPEVFTNLKNSPKFDAVVLSAGSNRLRDVEMSPGKSGLINYQAQVSLAEYFVESGCQKLVFLSSNRVFDGRFVNRDKLAKYSFTTEYGRQKARAETELFKLGQAVRVIRLTKVLSEHNLLLRDWFSKLTSGQEVKAFVDVMVSPVTLDDTVKVIAEVVESESESVTQFSAIDEISYFDVARFVAKFLQVDASLVVAQNAEEVGEIPMAHASLECSEFRSVNPSSSIVALQKVLEKMVQL
jgi:dTDP-4-dehydrorhamnose reductase